MFFLTAKTCLCAREISHKKCLFLFSHFLLVFYCGGPLQFALLACLVRLYDFLSQLQNEFCHFAISSQRL